MTSEKKLVISPHMDDEVLGCGGILDEHTMVLHCGVEDRSYVSAAERKKEIEEAQKIGGFKTKDLNNEVNRYKVADLIADFERVINELKPDKVFIPYPSYNQDHRAVFDAALTALRPHDQNFFVKKVLIYEQPHVFFWSENKFPPFKPNHYVPIDIDRKVEMYKAQKTQVRSFRSPEHLRAMATLRGGQSNCPAAEAFEIIRWIE